jgi:hypothetical protein
MTWLREWAEAPASDPHGVPADATKRQNSSHRRPGGTRHRQSGRAQGVQCKTATEGDFMRNIIYLVGLVVVVLIVLSFLGLR